MYTRLQVLDIKISVSKAIKLVLISSRGVDNFLNWGGGGGGGGASCLELLLTPLGESEGMTIFFAFLCSDIVSGAISLVESYLAVCL